jgi:hypothetical protein
VIRRPGIVTDRCREAECETMAAGSVPAACAERTDPGPDAAGSPGRCGPAGSVSGRIKKNSGSVPETPSRAMLPGRNTGPRAVGRCNASGDTLTRSRRRPSDCSGPVPRFSRFVPDPSGNRGEKWYNRGWYGHCCTSFPSGDFTPAKSTFSVGDRS